MEKYHSLSTYLPKTRLQIKARENLLKPIYLQAATEFADLHDKTGRMKAKKVIRDAVPWEESREFFFNRAQRRMLEDGFAQELQMAGSLSTAKAKEALQTLADVDWESDSEMIEFYQKKKDAIASHIKKVRSEALDAQLKAIQAEMDEL